MVGRRRRLGCIGSAAPKGRDNIAQGNALGRGQTNPANPERAKQETGVWDPGPVVPPRQGLGRYLNPVPRALPWAMLLRPFRAGASRGALILAKGRSDAFQVQTSCEMARRRGAGGRLRWTGSLTRRAR